MASFGIGAKLRQERLGKGLSIDEISHHTRIAPRFLQAIEIDDYSILPGLIFTRNFVRQYAEFLHLDPDPLLAELPTQNESAVPLPAAPAYFRTFHSILPSLVWLLAAGGACVAAYLHFNGSAVVSQPAKDSPQAQVIKQAQVPNPSSVSAPPQPPAPVQSTPAAPVRVSVTAHQTAWLQVSEDGKTTFTGLLQPDETKEISAAGEVKILTGNAGALTISLNGKTLESLGPLGQVRTVKLTAEGPRLLSKAPPPPHAPDPL